MPRKRITKAELEQKLKVLQESLKVIERYARRVQSSVCCYATTEGDRRPCDCKYLNEDGKYESRYIHGEQTGCCEARFIIYEVMKTRQ